VSRALLTTRQVIIAVYVALGTYTDQGIREINQTVSRTRDFKSLAEQYGMTVRDVFWMRGQQYDMVTTLEAPDQGTADTLLLVMNKKGFIRTQLLRAYTAAEIETFLTAAA
jgi:uncharacterized protein with GYD domain